MRTDNVLLTLMNPSDRSLLIDVSEVVELPYRQKLEEPHRRPPYVYFMESGMASLMYLGAGDYVSEVALVGREGCTGCGAILGIDRAPQGTSMQVAGKARRIETGRFMRALDDSRELHRFLLRFVHTQTVQRDETTLAASRGKILHRLARWLLMVQDRLSSDDLPLTHEVIAFMLSVRRAGVTATLGDLHTRGLIDLNRGNIQVRNRDGLKQIAGVFYGATEAEFERVIGKMPA